MLDQQLLGVHRHIGLKHLSKAEISEIHDKFGFQYIYSYLATFSSEQTISMDSFNLMCMLIILLAMAQSVTSLQSSTRTACRRSMLLLLAFYILFLQYNARLTTYLDLLMSSRVPAGDWLGVLKLLLHYLHNGLAVQALEGVMNQLQVDCDLCLGAYFDGGQLSHLP